MEDIFTWREFWITGAVLVFYILLTSSVVAGTFSIYFGLEALRRERLYKKIDKQRQKLNKATE